MSRATRWSVAWRKSRCGGGTEGCRGCSSETEDGFGARAGGAGPAEAAWPEDSAARSEAAGPEAAAKPQEAAGQEGSFAKGAAGTKVAGAAGVGASSGTGAACNGGGAGAAGGKAAAAEGAGALGVAGATGWMAGTAGSKEAKGVANAKAGTGGGGGGKGGATDGAGTDGGGDGAARERHGQLLPEEAVLGHQVSHSPVTSSEPLCKVDAMANCLHQVFAFASLIKADLPFDQSTCVRKACAASSFDEKYAMPKESKGAGRDRSTSLKGRRPYAESSNKACSSSKS